MQLTDESLLSYQGLNGMDGVAHVRLYEAPGQLPVVIAGQLDDNPGTRLGLAIEMVAASIQASLFRDGREFRLIQYEPTACSATPGFSRSSSLTDPTEREPGRSGPLHGRDDRASARAARQSIHEFDEAKMAISGIRSGRWSRTSNGLLGCAAQTWARGEYTALAVAGPAGEALREQLQANNRVTADRVWKMLGG